MIDAIQQEGRKEGRKERRGRAVSMTRHDKARQGEGRGSKILGNSIASFIADINAFAWCLLYVYRLHYKTAFDVLCELMKCTKRLFNMLLFTAIFYLFLFNFFFWGGGGGFNVYFCRGLYNSPNQS